MNLQVCFNSSELQDPTFVNFLLEENPLQSHHGKKMSKAIDEEMLNKEKNGSLICKPCLLPTEVTFIILIVVEDSYLGQCYQLFVSKQVQNNILFPLR
jgi:hypothetical protein